MTRPAASAKASDAASTRARLIAAASKVCAERGLQGTTTREIAEEAGVNEVTLFRQFGSKDKLMAAMFAEMGLAQAEALIDAEPDTNDLRQDLRRFARRLNDTLFANEALIRTLIGEAQRQPDSAKKIIYEAVRPMKQRLVDYIRRAQVSGVVRTDLNVEPSTDAFTGMLLSGMLRRTSVCKVLDYSHDEYLENCVDLFLRAIEVPAAKAKK